MSLTGRTVAAGTTGSLTPDPVVAIDNIGGRDYQITKLYDATVDSTTPIGTDSNPMRVRDRRRGTSDYDSGSVSVAANATPQAVTASTIYALGGYVVNRTDQVQKVTITDTAGDEILKSCPLQPGESKPLPIGDGVGLVGIKAGSESAANAGDLKLRIWGTQ